METRDFFFDLPPLLVAQYPPAERGQSRLMTLERRTGKREHRMVGDLPDILSGSPFLGGDGSLPLLVFNDSRVRKARLIGTWPKTGAKVECLLIERDSAQGPFTAQSCTWRALIRNERHRKPGSRFSFFDSNGERIANAEVLEQKEKDQNHRFGLLCFDRDIDDEWLERYGHVPLPPYIKREDAPADAERYQTVYAAATGSAAAPTSGLHFTRDMLDRIAAAGIDSAFVTLHVGLGTFLPVRRIRIEDHVMHRETFIIDEPNAAKIEAAKAAGRRIVAVGTTSVRALESAWEGGRLRRGEDSTAIFIYPGYAFNVVDALFTNFHTPESTLLMLVSAFADGNGSGKSGRELILESYAEAIEKGYRFFSYGDAMLIV